LLFKSPIDLLKTKLQVQVFESRLNPKLVPHFTTMIGCFKHTVSTTGYKGLYQGLTGTAVRNVPANAVFFPGEDVMS
jgi:hypothetical protein